MKVLVCGGPSDWVKGAFQKKLAQVGFEMKAHWPMRKRPPAELPKGVSLVLILQDFIGHSLRKSIISRVPKDIPYIEIPMRRWSESKLLLERKGLLPEVKEPEKEKETEKVANTFQEMFEVVEAPAASKPAGVKFSLSDAIEIEFDTNLLANPENIEDAINSVFRYYEGTVTKEAVKEAIHKVWADKAFCYRQFKVEAYDDAVSGWINRYAEKYNTDFGAYPAYRTISVSGEAVFGRRVTHNRITRVSHENPNWLASIKGKRGSASTTSAIKPTTEVKDERDMTDMFVEQAPKKAAPEPEPADKKQAIVISADEAVLKDISWHLLKLAQSGAIPRAFTVELTD